MLSVSIGAGVTAGAAAVVSLSVFSTGSVLTLLSATGAGLATVAVLTLLCLSLIPTESRLAADAEAELASLAIAESVDVCDSSSEGVAPIPWLCGS